MYNDPNCFIIQEVHGAVQKGYAIEYLENYLMKLLCFVFFIYSYPNDEYVERS